MSSASPPADWTCDTCTLTMPAMFQNSHLRGKRNLARIWTSESPELVPQMWWTCESCHVTLRDECRDAHGESRLHQATLKKERDIGKGYKGARRAVVKAMEEGDESGVARIESKIKAARISGKSHLAKARAGDVNCAVESTVPKEVFAKVVGTWRCTTCDVVVNTGSMESHLSGTAHRVRIQAGKPDNHQPGDIVRRQEPGNVSNTAKASKAHSPAKLPFGGQRNLQCDRFRSTIEEQRLRDAGMLSAEKV
ncbi:hypothetical protein Q9L58_009791 [Maublancomyces gigas]|uniref:C2H2-type domain-containing protein n=1 Tax=Discina gigas TaxID=1032678 RepID=A0ABR3G6D2_9PEZI